MRICSRRNVTALAAAGMATVTSLSGCASASAGGSGTRVATVVSRSAVGSVLPSASSALPRAASRAAGDIADAPSQARAPQAGFTMPREVGRGLQAAQDDVQRVAHDPVFFSHSRDLRGSRFQVIDSDWQVCTQNVPAGRHVSATGHVVFGVVKLTESCP